MLPSLFVLPVLMDENKEEEAIAELSGAIAFKPDLQLLHLRAAFFDSMGDTASTMRDCEAALCLDRRHPGAVQQSLRQGRAGELAGRRPPRRRLSCDFCEAE
jgi:hypothetical protein